MEFKAYYYVDENKCIISKKNDSIPDFESVNNKDSIVIDLESKNVENIYDFFRNNVLKSILSSGDHISIDYSQIESETFYSEDSFLKLIQLIEQLKEESNKSITECLSEVQDNATDNNQNDENNVFDDDNNIITDNNDELPF